MTPRRAGLRIACAVLFGLAAPAAADPVTAWQDTSAPDALPTAEAALQTYIDALADSARVGAVAQVATAWADAAPRASRRQSATRVLCRIAPFAEPASATKAVLGAYFESVWADFRADPTEQTLDEARFADCAAQNIEEGGYFGLAPNLPQLIPFGDCADAEAPPQDLLRTLDEQLTKVIEEASRASYYRVRAQYYGALTRVALALHDLDAPGVAFEAQRDAIAAAGRDLLDAAADEDFLDGRNAWRFHNDFRVIGAIFALIAPEPHAGSAPHEILQTLAKAAPVLDDPALRAVIEPWLIAEIEQTQPDYIDPVRVDRLFPWLLEDAAEDCTRNRRQSIETHDLAAAALQCHVEVAPIDRWSRLRAYDDCLTEVQSRVWWVQLGAFRSAEAAEAERAELEALLGTGDTPELRVIPPDAASAYYRIRTLPELTRSEAGDIEALVTRSNKQILIGRQRLY